MTSADDLANRGFILNRPSADACRTFIITGLQRSGTSLVASVLQHAGLFIGHEINDIVFEDEAIARVLVAGDITALRAIIVERNANHAAWGFKFPALSRVLTAGQLAMFDTPCVIATFRDPVAMAVRAAISEYQEPISALHRIAAEQAELLDFTSRLACPSLLISYEKALTAQRMFIDALMQFCRMDPTEDLRARLVGLVEPGRPRYLAGARRRFEGLIEGVRGDVLYGWCRLTQSDEPVALDILVDDRVAARVVAGTFRGDLLQAGFGTGCHGFFVGLAMLQARPESVIRARVARHGVELDNSGKRLSEYGTRA